MNGATTIRARRLGLRRSGSTSNLDDLGQDIREWLPIKMSQKVILASRGNAKPSVKIAEQPLVVVGETIEVDTISFSLVPQEEHRAFPRQDRMS